MHCWLFHRFPFAVFYLLLLLFMYSSFYGIMCVAQEEQTATHIVELFQLGSNKKLLNKDGGDEDTTNIKIDGAENVFFAATDELIIALAKAKTTKNLVGGSGQPTDNLVAEYIKNKGNKWEENVLNSDKWTAQVVTNDVTPLKILFDKDSLAVVTKNQSIYIFAIKSISADKILDTSAGLDVVLVLSKVESGSTTVDKKITLNKEEALKVSNSDLKEKVEKEYKNEISSLNLNEVSAFVAGKDKKIVFLVRNKADNSKKNVTAFIQLKEEKTGSKQLELLHVEIPKKCYPYFFPWEDKIMMIPTDCGVDRSQKVKESTDMVTWNESSESFSRLWDVFQDKKGFTTTKINESTILFTYNSTAITGLDTHLWISDGTRMADVGTIVTKDEGPFYGSILYTNGELFTLYQKKNVAAGPPPDGTQTIVLKRLKDVMSEITRVLNAWKNSDDAVTKLCTESAVSEKYVCATNVSKNGLVGFLSGKGIADEWKDGYDFSNATVNGGTEFKNGFLFNGEKQGAKWSVGKAPEDQPYNFTDPGFTLLATVTIGNAESGTHNSILGVGLKGSDGKNKVSLFCTKDATWGVKVKDDQSKEVANKVPNKKCGANQQYQVALVYNKNKEISVYIDWENFGTAQQFALSDENQKDLQFYFGRDGTQENAESHVTVTNVLLYNRPFESTEIDNLKEHLKKIKETEKINKKEGTDTRRPEEKNNTGGSDQQTSTTLPPDTNENEKKEQKSTSPSRPGDGGVGGGVRVFSLLLAVLCVSAPLLHL